MKKVLAFPTPYVSSGTVEIGDANHIVESFIYYNLS
jgi:hypothetical protein